MSLRARKSRQDKRMGKSVTRSWDNIPPSLVRRKKHSVLDEMEDDYQVQMAPRLMMTGTLMLYSYSPISSFERSREGMLWSWIVANLVETMTSLDSQQRNNAWRVLTEDAASGATGRRRTRSSRGETKDNRALESSIGIGRGW